MRLPFMHPRLSELELFADGAEDYVGRQRTAAHLERCSKCRNTVLLMRELSRRPEGAAGSVPDPALLDRILASRAAGARVLLPAGDSVAPARSRPSYRLVAAAVLVVGLGLAALLGTREATAGSWTGDLQLNPARPLRGATVTVTYRPAERLAAERVLRLRARFRAAGDGAYWVIPVRSVALLERQLDGTFRGAFVLPDSVFFAALAVEDTTAARVDDNDERGWELLVHGPDDRPLLESLEQRVEDLTTRRWEEAYATVIRMTELYPGSYRAWHLRHSFDGWAQPQAADSIRAGYRDTVVNLVSRLRRSRTVALADLESLASTSFFEDTASHPYWRKRLLQADPRNQQIQQLSTVEVARAHQGKPVHLLAALDSLWEATGPAWGAGRVMVWTAIRAARDADDVRALRQWVERLRIVERQRGDPTVQSLLSHPALRREGMTRLRGELAQLAAAPPTHRGLGETAERYRRRVDATRRRMLADLGRALLDEGQVRAGLDTLAIATEKGWNRELFQRAGEARLSVRDTLGALEMYALLAADPRTTPAAADSLADIARQSIGAERWDSLLQQARAALPVRVLEDADPRLLRRRASVADRDGRFHGLSDLSGGQVTLVVFWSRFCGPAVQELPVVDSVAAKLLQRGVRVVSITEELPSAELDRFVAEKGVRMPVFHDRRGEAREAFNNLGSPAYYILDSSGRIRFRYAYPVDDLLVQAEALLAG